MADPEDIIDDEDNITDAVEDSAGADDAVADGEDVEDDAPEGDGDSDKTEGNDDDVAPEKDAAPSRKENRVAKLARERNELREKLARAEAIAEERSRPVAHSTQDSAAAARAREEKLALMDPQERTAFIQQERLDQMQQAVLMTQLQTQDAIDRNNYEMQARSNPVFAKHQAEVERRLAVNRNKGLNFSRREILEKILGERALDAKPNKKEKDAARERTESAKSKPVTGRSNSTQYRPSRGKESFEELERRLENVEF